MDERSNEKSILLSTTQMDSSLLTSKRMRVPSRKGLHTVSREKRKAILVAQTLISSTVKVMTEDDPSDLAVKTHNTHLVAYQQLTGVSSAPLQYSDQDCPARLFHYMREHFWKPNPHLHLGTKECKAWNPDPATRNWSLLLFSTSKGLPTPIKPLNQQCWMCSHVVYFQVLFPYSLVVSNYKTSSASTNTRSTIACIILLIKCLFTK